MQGLLHVQSGIRSSRHLWVGVLGIVFFMSGMAWADVPAPRSVVRDNERSEKIIKQAHKFIQDGKNQEAEATYRQALSADPQDARLRAEFALMLVRARRFQEGFDEATQATLDAPLDSRGYAIRGLALIRSGLFSQAYDDLKTALKINNRDEIATATLAEIAYYENSLALADRLIKDALSQNHEEPDYLLLLARISSRLERYRVAADALKDFLRYSPKSDKDRRERVEGVIRFYSYLGDTHTNVVQGNHVASIPLTVKGRRPYIQVKINGKGPLNFVVDTGAGVSVISVAAAEKIGLKPVATGGAARAVGGDGTFPIVYGVINSLEMGNVRINTIPVYIREIQGSRSAAPNAGTDGFLGLSVLTDFLVTLDYPNKMMSLEPGRAAAANQMAEADADGVHPSVVPFRLTESGLISIETLLDDTRKMNFIFDSGASTTVISDAAVSRLQWRHKILPEEKIQIVGAAGITKNVELMLAKSVQISDLIKEDTKLPVLDLIRLNESSGFEQHGILGGDFLQVCRVQIDFINQNLQFTPVGKQVFRKASATQVGKETLVP
ncbi:MAG: aspartyl protease family protein [Blastocatellia bacterium]|nr:aspartyl protease family protein [Blastocatellia bacterium]